MKNDDLLPLKKHAGTLAVIGPNANSREALLGNYHGTSSRYVTILEGLREYTQEYARILYSEGSGLTKN